MYISIIGKEREKNRKKFSYFVLECFVHNEQNEKRVHRQLKTLKKFSKTYHPGIETYYFNVLTQQRLLIASESKFLEKKLKIDFPEMFL